MIKLDLFKEIKETAIIALFNDDYLMDKLVLKGGSCIELAYNLHSRSSKDIDFSMEAEFDDKTLEEVTQKIETQYRKFFPDIGYYPFDFKLKNKPRYVADNIKMSGYGLSFKLITLEKYSLYKDDLSQLRSNSEPLGTGVKKDFVIEISKYEYCEQKEIKEIGGHKVYVYSPMLLVFEKLRAICQKMKEYRNREGDLDLPRARDFYDIFLLNTELGPIDYKSKENRDILKQVFDAKDVDLNLLSKVEEKRAIHENDFQTVLQTDFMSSKRIEIFDYYFEYVLGLIDEELEKFWIV